MNRCAGFARVRTLRLSCSLSKAEFKGLWCRAVGKKMKGLGGGLEKIEFEAGQGTGGRKYRGIRGVLELVG